jgi:hypothetical protein
MSQIIVLYDEFCSFLSISVGIIILSRRLSVGSREGDNVNFKRLAVAVDTKKQMQNFARRSFGKESS